MHLQVAGHPATPTHPVRGQLLRLQMVDGGLRRVLWGPDIYMVPWADEVLVGRHRRARRASTHARPSRA